METTNQNMPQSGKKSSVLKWALVLGIVIVFNLFINYAISLVYAEPASPYSSPAQVVPNYTTKESCLAVGGQWTENGNVQGQKVAPAGAGEVVPTGWCDANYTNQKNFDALMKVYQRNVFVILVLSGVIALVVSAFLSLEVLILGFSWGGVLSLIIASMRYWNVADNLVKVLILAFALSALVWVAVKKFKNN